MLEKRKSCRIPYDATVFVFWTADGEAHSCKGTCIELSDSGLSLEIQGPVPVGSSLTFQVEQIDFTGSAVVRNIQPQGGSFRVGVELSPETKQKIFGFSTVDQV